MEIIKLFWRAYNGHVLMVAFLIGLFSTVMIGLQQALANAEASVKGSLPVIVFLQNNVTDAEAVTLQCSIKAQDSEIQSIEYTSKDQAYQEAMKNPNLSKSLLLLKSNPLPASLTLRYSDRAWWERSEPSEKLRALSTIQEIRWDPQAGSLFRSLHRWRLWSLRFSAFVGMVLLVWAFIGLYRVLSLQSGFLEIVVHLGIGFFGGALAWGLWGVGVHSIQAEIPTLRPAWVWLVPMLIGVVSALGCFGLEIRHAD
jgi:hypothetical protein